MEKIIHSDKFIKFISLLVAIGLWFYVVYAENPEAEFWVRGIPITYINTEGISENSLIIMQNSDETPTISVKVKGRRRDTSLVSASNISATVDMRDVMSAGTYSLPVNIRFPIDGLTITDKKPYTVSVTVDSIIETTKNVIVEFTGSPAENHSPGDTTISPAIVRISGPSSVVNQITSAVATVDISGATKDFSSTVSVSLIHSNGKAYQGDDITLYNSSVDVAVPMFLTKTVPVVPAVYNPSNLKIKETKVTPETIEIKGTSSVIDSIKQLDTLPVTILNNSESNKFPLTVIYPDNVTTTAEQQECTVEFILETDEPSGDAEKNENE